MASPQKRDHAAAAQRQVPAQAGIPTVILDASGARIRTVGVHLTPFAPGVAGLAIDNPKRWRTFYGTTPEKVLRSTLARLRLAPGAVQLAVSAAGDLDLLAEHEQALESVPHAVFWDGLPEAEARAALEALRARGWTPDPPEPA
jgi:hypothetical protein